MLNSRMAHVSYAALPPWGEGNFYEYRPIDEKYGTRDKEQSTTNMFDKCATVKSRVFWPFKGGWAFGITHANGPRARIHPRSPP